MSTGTIHHNLASLPRLDALRSENSGHRGSVLSKSVAPGHTSQIWRVLAPKGSTGTPGESRGEIRHNLASLSRVGARRTENSVHRGTVLSKSGAPGRTSQIWRVFSSKGEHSGPRGSSHTGKFRHNLASLSRVDAIRTENCGHRGTVLSKSGAPGRTSQIWRVFISKGEHLGHRGATRGNNVTTSRLCLVWMPCERKIVATEGQCC